jgi:hypothetical protein
MTPEQRFENFYTCLQKSNGIWWEMIAYKFGKKDLRDVAQKLLIELHAEGLVTSGMDWKHVQNRYSKMLTWANDKDVVIAPPKAEPVVIHPEAIPFGPQRDEWLKKWDEAHSKAAQNFATERSDPYKQIREEWKKPDGPKYHPPSPEEIYKRDRHLEYVKYCYHPRTGEPNSNWMPEIEFNDQYENGLIN